MRSRQRQIVRSRQYQRTGPAAEATLPVPVAVRRGGVVAVLLGAAMLLTAGSAQLVHGDDSLTSALAIERTFAEVIAGAESGVVSIARRDMRADSEPQLWNRPFGRRPGQESISLSDVPEFFGTGVVIARDDAANKRYVLTNDHVLRGGRPDAPSPDSKISPNLVFDVYLSNQRRVQASVVAADPRSDLAVLELDLTAAAIPADEVRPLKLGDASEVRKGQLVLAMGNPYAIARDGSASASWGIVSNISRRPAGQEDREAPGEETIHQYGTLLHVDTRLDLGMSGGALLNLKGELVGLTTSLAALRGYEKSVGYAIPIDTAMRRIIDDLLRGLEVEYGFLGVHPADASRQDLRFQRAPGEYSAAARTEFVAWDSPAAQAGLQQDDLILEINGAPIRSAADLMREVGLLAPESIAEMTVWRRSDRRKHSLKARLGKWPVQDDSQIVATASRHPRWRGMSVDYPTSRRRLQTSDIMERYHRAVLIIEVQPGSAAEGAGVRVGDFVSHVEDVAVETPREFHAAVRGLNDEAELVRLDNSRVVVPPATSANESSDGAEPAR
jgi:serine protease Do